MPTDYEIIDVHVHLTRDAAQEQIVFPRAGWPLSWYWGHPGGVQQYMDFHGISHIVTVNYMVTRQVIATRLARARAAGTEADPERIRLELVERVTKFNRWACAEYGAPASRVLPFVMADPVLFGDAITGEIEECIALGARGLKMHPTLNAHLPDDERMYAVYERCQEVGLPILADTGERRPEAGLETWGAPMHWAPVLRRFPRLRLIMAHLPGALWEQRIDLAREFGDNLVFDIAGGFVDDRHPAGGHTVIPANKAVGVIRTIGVDRVLFGSDGPSMDPRRAAEQLVSLDLTDDEKEQILSRNARAFLGLT